MSATDLLAMISSEPRIDLTLKAFDAMTVSHGVKTENVGITRRHEFGLYSNDDAFLDDSTDFILAALKVGKAVILITTDLHQRGLVQRLQARDVDVAALVEQKLYISLDVADSLPSSWSMAHLTRFDWRKLFVIP